MKKLLLVPAAGMVCMLGGCFAPLKTGGITESFAQYCPPTSAPVVVLPFANETADMDAPRVLRKAFVEAVQGRGMNMVPVETSDEKLRENGITQGGQLGGVDPQTLNEILGVDYVFYGNVETFSSKNIMIYVSRWVKAGFKLVYTPKGELLWEAGSEAKEREYHLDTTDDDAMKAAMVKGLVSGLVQSALKKEAALVVSRALSTLPAFAEAAPGAPPPVQAPGPAAGALLPVGMPLDPEAAFRRLVASAGIKFGAGFLASTIMVQGGGRPDTTVKEFLTALQFGVEMSSGKMKLSNWRRKGPVYRVLVSGEGGSGDFVFRHRPALKKTVVRGADPATGKPSPALNPMIRGIGAGAGQ